jgi:hypothetical protein
MYRCDTSCEYGTDQEKECIEKHGKFLTFENAQKEISELTTGYEFRLTELEAKIEAAKPILDKIIAICQDRNDVTTCEECCDKKCCEEYDLNAILFPRKENLSEKFIKGCATPLKEPQENTTP